MTVCCWSTFLKYNLSSGGVHQLQSMKGFSLPRMRLLIFVCYPPCLWKNLIKKKLSISIVPPASHDPAMYATYWALHKQMYVYTCRKSWMLKFSGHVPHLFVWLSALVDTVLRVTGRLPSGEIWVYGVITNHLSIGHTHCYTQKHAHGLITYACSGKQERMSRRRRRRNVELVWTCCDPSHLMVIPYMENLCGTAQILICLSHFYVMASCCIR